MIRDSYHISECGNWHGSNSSGPQWPSLALLFHVKEKTSCTATIISPRWLVTSCTCITDISSNPLEWVAFGGPHGFTPTMEAGTQIKIVKGIIQHPRAKHLQHLVEHDLALIELHQPFQFTPSVRAACLASHKSEQTSNCIQVGWASTDIG